MTDLYALLNNPTARSVSEGFVLKAYLIQARWDRSLVQGHRMRSGSFQGLAMDDSAGGVDPLHQGALSITVGGVQMDPSVRSVHRIGIEAEFCGIGQILGPCNAHGPKFPVIPGAGCRVIPAGNLVVDGFEGPVVIHVGVDGSPCVLVGGVVNNPVFDQGSRKGEKAADP